MGKLSYDANCFMQVPVILVVSVSVSMLVVLPVILLNPVYKCNEVVRYKCSYGWVRDKNLCYYASKIESSWEQSIIHCSLLGGELAVISEDNADYLATVNSMITKKGYWVGMKRVDGVFKWINGKNATNISLDKIHRTYNCGYFDGVDIKAASCKSRKNYICVKYLEVVALT
ncbi:CNPV052 C-type lectin-like protein [Canarypox virus]|uniref:SWPV2-ORF048 n=2 Tax=Canarypox virus TaxID=44088 RepID=A0A1V0QG09_CNPV|nr:CNPV052 C-type lectin-like protein [Canarypox virus]ARE67268.1 SWPV2-ORF048 [Shearwaterpox virus]QRI42769.1 C-type lectin-like protein [Cheloniid poxvirus 1]QRM15682.1 c-type lectin-like protein [Penguinpox virus 2]QRM16012.1 c-type lectin-like protein [Albatrosspox virus]AAR83398.1 CNPV052 C-type lectin-like protein [Canarypox virus]